MEYGVTVIKDSKEGEHMKNLKQLFTGLLVVGLFGVTGSLFSIREPQEITEKIRGPRIHSFKNSTPYKAQVYIHYTTLGCKDDYFVVNPNSIELIGAALCSANLIRVTIEKPNQVSQSVVQAVADVPKEPTVVEPEEGTETTEVTASEKTTEAVEVTETKVELDVLIVRGSFSKGTDFELVQGTDNKFRLYVNTRQDS
jgi:hypothetical protein